MKSAQLKALFDRFQTKVSFSGGSEIYSGHINDTYLIDTNSQHRFVLQRINQKVFSDIPGLMRNKVLVSEHLLKKTPKEQHSQMLQFVKAVHGNYCVQDEFGNFWNMMLFIDGSKTFETASNVKQAFQGGRITGEFLKQTADMDPSELIEVIPNFHDMEFRFRQFTTALKTVKLSRKKEAFREIQFCNERRDEMLILKKLKDKGKLPVRITHNDTKISNILFNEHGKGIAMIDLDTVMPGIIHYDFGDAIRTICNTAAEDEVDLTAVNFDMEFYESYKKGFLEGLGAELTTLELHYLPHAVKTMIFIMGLRFLTDYLNNDTYYKTAYSGHNLVRAKNQFQLLRSFESQINES